MSNQKDRKTVLVTGFGPFGEHRVNASWQTVKLLAKKGLGNDIDLVTYEIPVEYDTVRKVLPTYWEKHAPDLVVQVGVSDYVSSFTLEQQAHNKGYTDPDMKGHPAEGSCCIVGEDDILVSGIDMSAVCNEMNKLGLAVTTEVSFLDCGRLLVVHVGVSGYANELTIEQQAHNHGYERLDVKGCTADDLCCVAGADEILIAGIDMKTVCEDVNNSGSKAKAEISFDPGRYLCDFSFFTSLHIDRHRCAFIHVPPLDSPYSAEDLAEGLKEAIFAMLRQIGL